MYPTASLNLFDAGTSPYDDLKCLGYLLVYFLKVSLPWQDLERNDENNGLVWGQKKQMCQGEFLDDLPNVFPEFFRYL